ncbi:MAG: phosphate ABC transporter permease PstA [Panacagrimonas sp.]
MFDRLAQRVGPALALLAALGIAAGFCAVLGDVLWQGIERLSWSFLTEAPSRGGRSGGIAPLLVSTLLLLAVCLAACLPLALGTALFLTETAWGRGRAGRALSACLDVLAGVPSIVFGLFGNAFFCVTLGLGFSILSGGLTLACMALPLLARAAEESLRAVPVETRQSAAALGLSRGCTIARLLLPAAAPGIAAGLVLAVGRALAETAALIFTSGYVDRMPESLADSGRALSVHIYDLAMNISGGEPSAYATALVLVALLLALNLITQRLVFGGRPRPVSTVVGRV